MKKSSNTQNPLLRSVAKGWGVGAAALLLVAACHPKEAEVVPLGPLPTITTVPTVEPVAEVVTVETYPVSSRFDRRYSADSVGYKVQPKVIENPIVEPLPLQGQHLETTLKKKVE